MDEIQQDHEVWEVNCDASLQGFAAVAQGDFVEDVGPLSLGDLDGQAVQSGIFAIQSGPELFVLGLGIVFNRRFGILGELKKAGYHLCGGAYSRFNGVNRGHNGFFLVPMFLAFAQTHFLLPLFDLFPLFLLLILPFCLFHPFSLFFQDQWHPFAIRLDDQNFGFLFRLGRRLLRIIRFHLCRIVGNVFLHYPAGQTQFQNPFHNVTALPVYRVDPKIVQYLPQQIRVTIFAQTQLAIQRESPAFPFLIKVRPHQRYFAKDREIDAPPVPLIGDLFPSLQLQCFPRTGLAALHKKQIQQFRSHLQQHLEQTTLNVVGSGSAGFFTRNIIQHLLKLPANILYNHS